MSHASTVYFVQAGKEGPIKIGVARDVQQRIGSLQTANHEKLSLIATVDGGRDTEEKLHRHFAGHRLQGEWFKPAADLLKFIAERCKKPDEYEVEKFRLWCEITSLCDRYNDMTGRHLEPRFVYQLHDFSCRCADCWYEHGGKDRSLGVRGVSCQVLYQ